MPLHRQVETRNRPARGAGLVWTCLALLFLAAPAARADDLRDARAAFAAGRLDDAMRLFEKAANSGLAEEIGRASCRERV